MDVLTTTDGQSDLPRYFRQVFERARAMNYGRIDVILPDGRKFRAQGSRPGPSAEIEVHNPDLFARLIREGDLGFSDAYLEGWWSTPDIQAFMDVITTDNAALYEGFPGMGLVRAFERVRHWLRSNSKRQAKKNISYHYDLGNDFYALWLDDSMTYSSALFRTGQESLERAQEQKYAALVDSLELQPGAHVLEIGCGWGGFAEYAAGKRGLRVTGLTISQAQHDYAVERMRRAGLQDLVTIKMCDYRDERGSYDAIASIEMFEAVGEKYWPAYFQAVRDRLAPGGKATIQVITVSDDRFPTYRRNVDFIQKYVFPGGMLISPGVFRDQAGRAGLDWSSSFEFGESYSQTLRRWHETFLARWDQIRAMGYDARFKRLWEFYLTSCASAFQTGICDVTQITLRRPV
jgi:cyclopropane-fatty-acyl-phospholipid synthase